LTTFALRSYELWLAQYRRVWRGTVVTSVVTPTLYLAALGVGLGTLVNRAANAPGGGSYLDFVAPGLLASAAMQIAAQESAWPVLGAIRWTRTYFAQLATPLGIAHILAGHQLFVLTRVAVSSAAYLVVIAAFGGLHSPLAALVPLAAILVGTAFSAPVAAFSARAKNDGAFNPLFRFGIFPMFLFSGTFFPVTRLPLPLEWLAYATPLWHGVELCRDLTLGRAAPLPDLAHAAYLVLWTAVGLRLALASYRRRLVS
jgi:lipooligosaccharide transport system permease protein